MERKGYDGRMNANRPPQGRSANAGRVPQSRNANAGRPPQGRSANAGRPPQSRSANAGRPPQNRRTAGSGQVPRQNADPRYRYENPPAARSRKRRRRRRRNVLRAFLLLFLLLIIACGVGVFVLHKGGIQSSGDPAAKTSFFEKLTQNAGRKSKSVPDVTVSLDSLDSPYAILIDKDTASVMGSKQGDVKIYPASMAKIMTVLTAIEHIKDLDHTITMSYDYYNTLYEQDASRAGFEPGEEAVIRDLLYGALLPSGAECCMELAIQAAGSEEAFAELMNQKAQEIGLTQTHFMNCTGLHHEEQYSTPQEIALILREALENKTFREVFTTHNYTVKPTSVHPDGFTFWSSMFKNMQAENVIGGEILGGKTGYTQAAGYCLASMAEVEAREYILVTAGWASNPRVNLYHINDAFLGYNTLGRALAELNEK